MNRWTSEQKAAIETRGSNLLVSAAAGSGKTAVLIQRIIQLVLDDGVDIDRLLVVTFTRAAAAEMRERAAMALMKSLDTHPQKEAFIRRQLALVNQAFIMTFHAFCIRVIQQHYYLIDLEPAFRTADQSETNLLQQEALDELLETTYEEADPHFLKLVEMYCHNRNDQALETMILSLHAFSRSQPKPDEWLQDQAAAFRLSPQELADSAWVTQLTTQTMVKLNEAASLLEEAIAIANRPDGPEPYLKRLLPELADIRRLIEDGNHQQKTLFQEIHSLEFQRLPPCRDGDDALKEAAKSLRDQVKKEVKDLQEKWYFRSLEDFSQDHQQVAEAMAYLTRLVSRFDEGYRHKKEERQVLDFNDLEHRALDILEIDAASSFYRNHFKAIFIDEYQDSNRVQEALIAQIKGPDNLFMVGDVKQSIYRFRLAEPELFMDKYRQFTPESGSLNQRIDLKRNFRSRPAILQAVNTVFRHIMSETLGEITYDDAASLEPGNQDLINMKQLPVQVHLLERKNAMDTHIDEAGAATHEDEVQELLEEWTDQEAEAHLLVRQIRQLMKETIEDPKEDHPRHVRYRDITILLRAPGNQAPHFMEVFSREGIPVYADLGTGFFDSLEIQLFLNLLRIIDNRRQDMPLLSVLRSPFGHFSTEDLTTIRLSSRHTGFYECFEAAGEDETPLGEKVRGFLHQLQSWRKQLRQLTLTDFLWWLFSQEGFDALCAAMPGGQQRQANVRILLKRAEEYAAANESSLYGFLTYVEKLAFRQRNDIGPARTLTENDDVVRMMSIHKSKGLEFPVVILAGLGKRFNRRDLQSPLLMHRSLGIGPLYVNPDLRIKRNTLARIAILEKSRLESLSEEMRVLYVAMTRAQHQLIMTGTISDLSTAITRWTGPVSQGKFMKAQHLLDWLGPVWVRLPEAKVLHKLAEPPAKKAMISSDANWSFHCWNRSDLLQIHLDRDAQQQQFKKELLAESPAMCYTHRHIFETRFTWQYPFETDSQTPGKISVTESTKQQEAVEMERPQTVPLMPLPRFMESHQQLSAADRGTAIHYVLQHMDFQTARGPEDIQRQIDTMMKTEMISQEEAAVVDPQVIMGLLDSELGGRMLKATKIFRELPFVLRAPDREGVLIQGIIDCCFEEEGQWVLVDYKTDHVLPEMLDRWAAGYQPQLALYRQALTALSGKKVKETLLYHLYLEQAVQIPHQDESA
ncbi:helicase-exonuclease AddAB subunit AddA [Anoxynatronum sibiricum]|uniref:ATP-dependent helicase/nuclease subunit A n=1 Tax=Anoxynatronum sibiricum TaxID=210623 RepID=A0ABU9VPJ4_9CLOT